MRILPKEKIKVVGIGGAGGNAVNRMMSQGLKGVELIAINTDVQDLKKIKAHFKLPIGLKATRGFGTGMNPSLGRKAALQDQERISQVLDGAEIIFITAGLGGGTGSGAGPVIAGLAKQKGILTICIVTLPFSFEGAFRNAIAKRAVKDFKANSDTVIVINNDSILTPKDRELKVSEAFLLADQVLVQAVQGITDLITLPGIINVNFADIRAIVKDSGSALFGIGKAKGDNRAQKAVKEAMGSPFLTFSPKGAKGVLFNVSGGKDISLAEVQEVAKYISQAINKDAKIIFGAIQDEKLKKGELKVTLIATGF